MLQAELVAGQPAQAVLAWGRKPSALKAEQLARKLDLPLVRAEDGFLRSFGTGPKYPALSVVLDSQGIYYDCTGPSDLEYFLTGDNDLLTDAAMVDAAIAMLLEHDLSKYNHAPQANLCHGKALSDPQAKKVLVLDQTFGDMSVVYGAANEHTFALMLQAAIDENPGSQIWVKTHPEVSDKRKRGYLDSVKAMVLPQGGELRLLRVPTSPVGLLKQVDCVYVVTSGMGFEALLCGKPVRCFGLPWYAGWGLTQDEQHCLRRTRRRSVRELFAAAYVNYSRYLDPTTHQQGNIFDVMQWLVRQRRIAGLT
jgi:capsular polysaccharide export protein